MPLTPPHEIQARHQKHLVYVRGWLNERGYFNALRALELIIEIEVGFRKDEVTPKAHHQISVTRLVMLLAHCYRNPELYIIVALLHDLYEDHGIRFPLEVIREMFGDEVAYHVEKLSKKGPGFSKDYENYFKSLAEDEVGSVVKPADRIHNLQSMVGVFSPEKQIEYAEEVEQWFFPLLRDARHRFPHLGDAYETLKMMLRSQVELIYIINGKL